MSLRTLKRRIKSYGLRRQQPEYNIDQVRASVQTIIDGHGSLQGYRSLWQKHWQLNGEKIQITVKFDHDCVVRNPTNSICFLLLGVSAMEVTFPVSHMKTYDDFKNVFILAFFIGQVFGKPGDK